MWRLGLVMGILGGRGLSEWIYFLGLLGGVDQWRAKQRAVDGWRFDRCSRYGRFLEA